MPTFVADEDNTYTEYGIQFPNGDRQWDSRGAFPFNLGWLREPEGRKQAQKEYTEAVRGLNLVPEPDSKLTFIKRRRAHSYSEVEVIDGGAGNE